MPRGGKRPGAGRPAGLRNCWTREALERAAAEGPLPLDVMLLAMREHLDAGNLDAAAAIAKDAAPYVHARLASVQVKGDADNPIPFKLYGEDPRCMWTPPTSPACTAPTNGAAAPHG